MTILKSTFPSSHLSSGFSCYCVLPTSHLQGNKTSELLRFEMPEFIFPLRTTQLFSVSFSLWICYKSTENKTGNKNVASSKTVCITRALCNTYRPYVANRMFFLNLCFHHVVPYSNTYKIKSNSLSLKFKGLLNKKDPFPYQHFYSHRSSFLPLCLPRYCVY